MAMKTSIPIEIFMPKYCVQGERIPFYILWKNSKNIEISVSLPTSLILTEIYNIDRKNISFKDGQYIAHNFEMNGYFGGIIKSQLYEEASSVQTVKFSINDNSGNSCSFDKYIEMFRPDVRISHDVSEITISNIKGKQLPDKHISLYNYGKGTGIVKIDILADSEIKEGIPEGFEKFKIGFLQDIKQSFSVLTLKFPQYKDIVNSFLEAVNDPLPSKSAKFETIRNTIKEIEKAFDNDEKFAEEFVQAVAASYLKNVTVLTDVISFLAFMKSVGKNKIIFVDAMKVLNISSTPKKLHANLIVSDLVQNEYQPIELRDITLGSDVKCTIPVYQIFDTQVVNY